MNQIRYIITRNCLQEGSMRLLKYNEGHFSQGGPAQFVDEQGREFAVRIDRETMRVTGLNALYHDHNLGVNDVMMLTPLGDNRFQVATVVKPHAVTPPAAAGAPRSPAAPLKAPEPQRVVVSSTPHVREVRLQRPTTDVTVASQGAVHHGLPSQYPQMTHTSVAETAPVETPAVASEVTPAASFSAPREVAALFGREPAPAPVTPARTGSIEDSVAEFAQLTGYHLTHPAPGLMRLQADLGQQHGYTVLLAADPLAMMQPTWDASQDEAKLVITHEAERPEGVSRLTREALGALSEHARLTPLSPLDLRGYWRAGNLDLDSAASISELVSAHLAQRGAFSYVLMALASQSANSIVSAPQLAERLGSGVNLAELHTTLDTLSRPPFLALTPLQGNQYLLRTGVPEILADLADYATGMRRRMRPGVQTSSEYQAVATPVHA